MPELLVVIAIIALTVGIVIPTFSGRLGASALKGSARSLAGTLREARRLAIADRVSYCVVIDCNGMTNATATADPLTRYWIARFDPTFDPTEDPTDLPDTDSLPPFDGVWSQLEQVGEILELPANIVVIGAAIQSTNYQGDDFAVTPFRINAMRTEDVNLNGGVSDTEDVGVNGINDGNGAIVGRNQVGFVDGVDAGEDDEADDDELTTTPVGIGEDIDSVYRVIRFAPQGGADRATIWLWEVDDETRTPLPADTATFNPGSHLRAMGVPPGLTFQTPGAPNQRQYFAVTDQTQDAHYYTVEVNATTGSVQLYDYARGTGAAGDWNASKDGQ